ncbi:phosphopentomutase [Clostridium sp. CAG:411]|jgi:phosphopentomutase|nr:phosphopentomutase [Lachnospiraceae bacterium]CDE46423.1 phosphopentomutase [Clostridium sp. CAG:411]
MKRVFLIVLDSVGVGEMPDAAAFGDQGSHTVYAASHYDGFYMPNMQKLGFFNLDGMKVDEKHAWAKEKVEQTGTICRLSEKSKGKDTTTGHWEIAGLISREAMPTFPNGFPKDLIDQFEKRTGRKVLCNKPYSGTEVIKDYGKEHIETGALIVYTSADSVFQIAAHESVVPVEQLYEYCEIARELCQGAYGVGRVIARPFEGEWPYSRTSRRHDYSLLPPKDTMLDKIKVAGMDVLAVGKINDIFAGKGVTEMIRTQDNADGIDKTIAYMKRDFHGLCFTNLVDFDMKYGHRNDIDGYGKALSYFDSRLPELLSLLKEEDVLMITADHGCDPSTPSTDHSREYVPWVITGDKIAAKNLGTKDGFGYIGGTILDMLGLEVSIEGDSIYKQIKKGE